MKLVIQRVKSAKVEVGEKIVGQIKTGLFVLVGFEKGDSLDVVQKMGSKLVRMRLFPDQMGKLNLSTLDMKSEILLVSQFTLCANTKEGNRPSFINAEEGKLANLLYQKLIEVIRAEDVKVETGSFGNYMDIKAHLDGPVTILMNS